MTPLFFGMKFRNRTLGVVGDSINPNFRIPEAVMNLSMWNEFFQIQLTPAMQTEPAKQILDTIRLVFSVGPQLC